MRKITVLSMLLIMVLFSVLSCAPTVSQEEYDRVSNELSAVQSQLASLQDKLSEVELLQFQNEELKRQYDAAKSERETIQAQYDELSTEYEELNKQIDTVKSEFETMQAESEALSTEFEELNNEYEELSEQYNILMEGTTEINEGDIEQATFELVNQERIDNGLAELEWGTYLYKEALANSRNMATRKRIEYPEFGWQEVFWATGYGRADRIAKAAVTIWKNSLKYETNFLNAVTKYGAIAVYKSGEIFYITYVADYFQ